MTSRHPPTPQPSGRRGFSGPRRLKIAAAAVAAVLLYWGLAGLLLPFLARPRAETVLSDFLERNVSIQAVEFNPFTFAASVKGVAVKPRGGGQALFSFKALHVDMDPANLVFGEVHADDLHLESPNLLVVRYPDGSLNLQRIARGAAGATNGTSSKQLAFSVHGLRLSHGEVRVRDELEGVSHTISGLNFSLPFLGNTPELREKAGRFSLSAEVNGAAMDLQGVIRPFAKAGENHLELSARQVRLPEYQPYLPREANLTVASGLLDGNASLRMVRKPGGARSLEAAAAVRLSGVRVRDGEGEPLLDMSELLVQGTRCDVLDRRIQVESASVAGLGLHVARGEAGQVNLAGLIPSGETVRSPGSRPAPPARPPASWRFALQRFDLRRGRVGFRDDSLNRTLRASVDRIELRVRDLRYDEGFTARADASCRLENRTRIAARVEVRGEPWKARGRVEVQDLRPARFWSAYAPDSPVAMANASLDARADAAVVQGEDGWGVRLENASAGLRHVLLQEPGGDPLLRLGELAVNGSGFDWSGRRLWIGAVRAVDGELDLTIDEQGKLQEDEALHAAGTNASEGAERIAESGGWSVRLGHTAVQGFSLCLHTPGLPDFPPLRVENVTAEVDQVAVGPGEGNATRRSTARASFELPPGGRVEVRAEAGLSPFSAQGRVRARSIPLVGLSGLARGLAGMTIPSGTAEANVTARVRMGERLEVRLAGDAGVRNATLRDEATGYNFAGVDRGEFLGIRARLHPLDVSLEQVRIQAPRFNVVRRKSGDMALPSPPEKSRQSGESEGDETEKTRFEAPEPLPVRVSRWIVRDGRGEFTDSTTEPAVQVRVHGLQANATHLPSGNATPGRFAASGRIGEEGRFHARGETALAAMEFDVEFTAREVELTTFSPYAVLFTGRRINRGQADLDLDYRIHGGRLEGRNHVVLKDFRLGAEEGGGLIGDVSVGAALNLLRDSQGDVTLNAPVSGDLLDPQFDYSRVLASALTGTLTSVLAMPFKFLKLPLHLLGAVSGERQAAFVPFRGGETELTKEGRRELVQLAEQLRDKPEVHISVAGCSSPEVDAEGLARFAYRHRLRKLKVRRELKQGAASAREVRLSLGDEREYLPFIYRDVTGGSAPLSFSQDEDLGPWVEEVLSEIEPTEVERMLFGLARARAVERYLTGLGVDPGRVDVVRPDEESCSPTPGAPPARGEIRLEY